MLLNKLFFVLLFKISMFISLQLLLYIALLCSLMICALFDVCRYEYNIFKVYKCC